MDIILHRYEGEKRWKCEHISAGCRAFLSHQIVLKFSLCNAMHHLVISHIHNKLICLCSPTICPLFLVFGTKTSNIWCTTDFKSLSHTCLFDISFSFFSLLYCSCWISTNCIHHLFFATILSPLIISSCWIFNFLVHSLESPPALSKGFTEVACLLFR